MSTCLTKEEIRFIRERLDPGDRDEYSHTIEAIDRKLRLMELTAPDANGWTDLVHEIAGRRFIERTYRAHYASVRDVAPTRVIGYWILFSPVSPEGSTPWKIHEVINRSDFAGDCDLAEYAVANGTVVLFEIP